MRWRLSLHRERVDRAQAPAAEPTPRSRLDAIQERQLSTVFEPPRASLRRNFIGVTIVATFNAVVVGIGAVLLDVPLAGTIAVVTLVTACVPFIGAFVSGAFAVVLALGSGVTSTALVMLVVVLLANGLLQNIVRPIAFVATLDLNPLLVLVVTIAAGSLFGMFGLILAAPLVSAGIHIVRDVGEIRTPSRTPADAGPSPPVPA
jgi:predicted PurR-regulated permease PerM